MFPVVIVSDDDDLAPRDVRAEARRAIEAVVLAATEPVPARTLAELVECSVDVVAADLRGARDRVRARRPRLRARRGRRRLPVPDPSRLAPYVEQFVLEGQHVRLSGPALETLAIVAYKQPITRGQISAIRGVSVESTLATLVQRGYVEEVGRDPGPGLAVLYGTTSRFLERLGLGEPRRPAVARRLRARSRGRRGARARPAPRPGPPPRADPGRRRSDDDPA